MSYVFGVLALISFFAGLAGAVNVNILIAALGFGLTGVCAGGILIAEARRNRRLS